MADHDAAIAIDELAEKHPMVAAFRDRRSVSPVGQEPFRGLTSKITAYTLHAGPDRGATWHDERNGVVWLLASGFHRSGKPDDAYPYIIGLDAEGRLLPTRADYVALVRFTAATLAKALSEDVPPLLAAARAEPASIRRGTIGGRIQVRVAYENGDDALVTVAVSQRLLPGELPLPPDWNVIVAAAFLPDTPPAELSGTGEIAGQPLEPGEWAFCGFAGA